MIPFVMPYELKAREERFEYIFKVFDEYEAEQGKIAKALNHEDIYSMHEHTRFVIKQIKDCIRQAERVEEKEE